MSTKKIAVFHDHFMYRGGGERLITLLAKSLNADLISAFFDEGSLDPRELGFEGKVIEITKPGFAFFDKRSYQSEKKGKENISKFKLILFKGIRHFLLKYAIIFKTGILKEYDTVIFSGDAIGAIKNCRIDAETIYYCHTPPRYLFDQKDEYLEKVPAFLKPFYNFACFIFRKFYKKDFEKIGKILTNSETVKSRIKTFLGRDAIIVYPPVDISFFKPSANRGDYYYSWARLTDIKRVDVIAEAFLQMPDKNLIISYGKNDPDKDKIADMIKGSQNISIIESPTDEELRKLISESIATIYIPREEDFGMSPVESMACGVPVIGVDEGGLRESIIDGKTGILIPRGAKVEDLKKAVGYFTIDIAKSMSSDCINRAKYFSLDSFSENIKKEVL